MLISCTRILVVMALMALLCATKGNVYAQEDLSEPLAPLGQEAQPYTFDGDAFIIDRTPKTLHKVTKVISADTILLDNGKRVKLLGVELTEEDANRAYRFLQGLLEGKEVRLEFKRRNRDIHGNLLAVVYRGELNVNTALKEDFDQEADIDPAFFYNSTYLDSIYPEREKPMDFWEVTLGEDQPPEKKVAVVKLKARNKPVMEGELVRETKKYIVIRTMYRGLEIIRKNDIKKLTFK